MIKGLIRGEEFAIRYKKNNIVLGWDTSYSKNVVEISSEPVFWLFALDNQKLLTEYNSEECQNSLYKEYEVDTIEIHKRIFGDDTILADTYVLNTFKKNLGIIEFIPKKNS